MSALSADDQRLYLRLTSAAQALGTSENVVELEHRVATRLRVRVQDETWRRRHARPWRRRGRDHLAARGVVHLIVWATAERMWRRCSTPLNARSVRSS